MSFFIFLITLIFRLRITVAQKSDLNSLKAEVIPLQQCECVPFYKCNSTYDGNIVYGTKCADNSDVCCKPEAIVDISTLSSHQPTQPTTIAERPGDAEKACCRLPPPQQNGKFSPSKRRCPPDNTNPYCQMTPGNIVPHNWALFHSCDPGYVLNDTNLASVCLDGQWRPPLPRCGKQCSPLETEETAKKCEFKDKLVSCDNVMDPGTVARAECPQFYRTNLEIQCDSGSWVNLKKLESNNVAQESYNDDWFNGPEFRCIPECGVSTKLENTGINTGFGFTEVKSPREYPWVAAIYYFYQMKCLGTLVTTRHVLTAAGCVENLELQNIRVGLGKLDANFYTAERSSVVIEVDQKAIHERYNPEKKEMDVALLELLYDVHVTASVMPVCLNSKHGFTLAPGTIIPVTGWTAWAISGIDKRPEWNDIIYNFKLKITENTDCLPFSAGQRNFTGRFCVTDLDPSPEYKIKIEEVINGSATTFQEEGRHFLKGITTNGIFTDVTFEKILPWIKKTIYEQLSNY